MLGLKKKGRAGNGGTYYIPLATSEHKYAHARFVVITFSRYDLKGSLIGSVDHASP